jgi:diguanylate cyclase (GGDEF)-like protein
MTESYESPLRPQDISVLVVDDNYSVLEAVQEFLVHAGFQVTAVTTGDQATKLLKEKRFHVLLADLRMSPVSGWEVIRQAKEFGNTEVIVMTGYASLDSSLEALRHRVFDFLQKPIDFERLERAVRNAANHNALTHRNRELVMELAAKNAELEAEVARVRAELEELIIHDELTGLYNYRYLQTLLASETARALRYHHPVTLAMLDLDDFKDLNDQYGHFTGNQVMARVAKMLANHVRQNDTVCRFGGEEFSIVFPVTTKLQAEPILKRISQTLKEACIPAGKGRFLTCSAGVASVPDDADSVEGLIRYADDALYQAKARGKDCVVLASALSFQ